MKLSLNLMVMGIYSMSLIVHYFPGGEEAVCEMDPELTKFMPP